MIRKRCTFDVQILHELLLFFWRISTPRIADLHPWNEEYLLVPSGHRNGPRNSRKCHVTGTQEKTLGVRDAPSLLSSVFGIGERRYADSLGKWPGAVTPVAFSRGRNHGVLSEG